MALQDFAKLGIFYNGNALTKVTSISLDTNSGEQRIDLLNEGLAGFTPGSGDCSIEVGFVVPIGGLEDEFQEDCATGTYVTLQVPVGRKSFIGRGKLQSVKISQSTNANVEGSFSWMGELKPLA